MKKYALLLSSLLANLSIEAQTLSLDWSMKANGANNAINGVAFSPDGQKVLSGTNCHPASIRLFDLADGSLDWDYTVGNNFMCIMGVAISSNSNYIAAIEEFGNIFIFDNTTTSPTILDTIATGTTYGFATAISPDNTKVAVACSNGKLKIYNISNGTLANDINAHTSWTTALAYAPNGNFIVTGGTDDLVKIWDTSNGNLLFTASGHLGDITSLKVSHDNNYIVSASKDNTIKIWNAADATLQRTITEHNSDVNAIDISPDGSKIASAALNNNCKIFNFSDGALLATFDTLSINSINAIAWSPDGNKIATGNAASDLNLWSFTAAPTHINQQQQQEISFTVFPNPAQNQLFIQTAYIQNIEHISIADMHGRIVFDAPFNNEAIDISYLVSGIYTIAVQSQQHRSDRIIFIKH